MMEPNLVLDGVRETFQNCSQNDNMFTIRTYYGIKVKPSGSPVHSRFCPSLAFAQVLRSGLAASPVGV